MLRAAAFNFRGSNNHVAISASPSDQIQVRRLIETHPSGPLSPTSVIANGISPGSQTQVHRLIETHPSGPLSPTSVIANGMTSVTPQASDTPSPGDQTQVHRLIETHPWRCSLRRASSRTGSEPDQRLLLQRVDRARALACSGQGS